MRILALIAVMCVIGGLLLCVGCGAKEGGTEASTAQDQAELIQRGTTPGKKIDVEAPDPNQPIEGAADSAAADE
jgi:hypothetical protein